MTKLVILKIVHIAYQDDSIGDDIRIEVEALGTVVGVNKKLRKGSEAHINADFGQLLVDQLSLEIPVKIIVIERDPIFNDVGSTNVILNIDVHKALSQRSTHIVTVTESRGVRSQASALFHVTLEAVVASATRSIREVSDGWLRVKREDSEAAIDLPAHLTVQLYRITAKREYFTILEGSWRGVKASVKFDKGGLSFLALENPHTKVVFVTYSISKKTLYIGEHSYLTRDYLEMPWKKGLYDIELPDAPHRGGIRYQDVVHAKTWFRVGHSGERFIHTGRNSLGCITVLAQQRWEEIYQVLIKARKDDGVSVGTLEVVD